VAGLAAIAGVLVIASTWVDFDRIERGVLVAALTCVAIVALEASSGGLMKGVLSFEPIAYLGRISYGTYLWHWLVVLVLQHSFAVSDLSRFALTAIIATGLASLSFHLLERPIRVSALLDRYPAHVIVTGLASSVVVAWLVIPAILGRSPSSSVANSAVPVAGSTPVPNGVAWQAIRTDFPPRPVCDSSATDRCTLVRGEGPHIMLIGDSHARMLVDLFVDVARDNHLTFSASARGACPWQRGLYVSQDAAPAECQRYRDDLYDRVIPALDPDLVVTINGAYVSAGGTQFVQPDGSPLSGAELSTHVEDVTTTSLADLTADGRGVVMLEPIPFAPAGHDPLECLDDASVVEECRYVFPTAPADVEQLYRRLADENDRLSSVDLDPLVCPYLPICDPIVDHVVVKFDRERLTSTFARSLAPAVERELAAAGVIA
jgi:hypothetical protein